MASPATTSASAGRLQARNVRSFAKVNLGSGSVPPASRSTAGGSSAARRLDHDIRRGPLPSGGTSAPTAILPVTDVTPQSGSACGRGVGVVGVVGVVDVVGVIGQ